MISIIDHLRILIFQFILMISNQLFFFGYGVLIIKYRLYIYILYDIQYSRIEFDR